MVNTQELRIPAHRFRQGGRVVYACVLDLPALNARLPDRIDDRVVRDANRQLTPSHARRIQTYLAERDDWVLSALMLGVPPEMVEFDPYIESDGASMQVGELQINAECPRAMKMFDGQHRRRAIKDVVRELELDAKRHNKLTDLQGCSLPIMLYVEGDTEKLRQMFADAAQTKTIERNVVARFDLRDPFNLAALWLKENSVLFVERVEMERASVPRTSENIIAINQLSLTLKTLEVGYKGRVSKDLSDQYMVALDDLYERCWDWADDFMPAAREEYEWLISGDVDNSEIPHEAWRRPWPTTPPSYACSPAVTTSGPRAVPTGSHWPSSSRAHLWNLGSGLGALLVDAGLVAEGGITPFARAQLLDLGD